MMNPSLEESKEICLIKENINNEQLIKAGEIVEKSINQVAAAPHLIRGKMFGPYLKSESVKPCLSFQTTPIYSGDDEEDVDEMKPTAFDPNIK